MLVGSESKVENKAEGWMEHPLAARYDAIDFNPSLPPGDNGTMWNTWRGFAVEPKKGDWSLLQEYIRENIADNDAERAESQYNWMADAVQNPSDVLGTAPGYIGPPGTGKTILAKLFGAVWWPHDLTLTSPEHVRGRSMTSSLDAGLYSLTSLLRGGTVGCRRHEDALD